MKDSNRLFYIINEEGIKQEADVLAKYKLTNGFNYITYTYGEINDNDMIKIYSTGIVGSKGNYSYKSIDTTPEWEEIKDILKVLAKEDTVGVPAINKTDLKIIGEEISVRKPKKLLVSTKFAKTLGSKYTEEDSTPEVPELKKPAENLEVTKLTLPAFDLPEEKTVEEKNIPEMPTSSISPLDIPSKVDVAPQVDEEPIQEPVKVPEPAKISVPTFEELQARSKKVTEVMESSKPELSEVSKITEENKPEKQLSRTQRQNYADKFKSEVEPVLLDVYSKQQAQIDALEEELSRTKYDLFEEQKVSLSLKTANKELTEKSNRLESELNESKSKVDGIMNLLKGDKVE